MSKSLKILPLLLFFLLFLAFSGIAQINRNNLSSKSKTAKRSLLKAIDAMSARDLNLALFHTEKAIKSDSNFVEAYMILTDIYQGLNEREKGFAALEMAISINPEFYAFNLYRAGRTALQIGKYEKSVYYFERFIKSPQAKAKTSEVAQGLLEKAKFGVYAINNPVTFDPQNLGKGVNTEFDDYVNAITIDDSLLIYTIKEASTASTSTGRAFEENFYVSNYDEDIWKEKNKLPQPLNSSGDEGAICITPDGLTAYFAAKKGDKHIATFDIYVSYKEGANWTKPINLGTNVNDNRWWDSQPSISADGRTLYFISNRKGGYGSSDIYVTYLNDFGGFSVPENLGPTINTKHEEFSPRIHPDGRTLYFASKGHKGMGGFDIFFSQKDILGNWSEPKNLGYPINTFSDEYCPVLSASGKVAYLSSDQFGGEGGMDIFSFELAPELRPDPVTYMKGRVFDKETKKALFAAFQIIDLESGNTITSSFSDPVTGDFMIAIPLGRNYALNAEADKYLFYSDNFSLKGIDEGKPYYKDVPMTSIKASDPIVLENIFFETGKYELLSESFVELKKLIVFLKRNPSIQIEIGGHTDDVANDDYNQKLSENRARAVYNYLVENEIQKSRLEFKGYGEKLPIDDNSSEKGRANNRRTEFRIIND